VDFSLIGCKRINQLIKRTKKMPKAENRKTRRDRKKVMVLCFCYSLVFAEGFLNIEPT